MLKDKKIAVLGAGKLGEILIKGLLEAGVINIANIRITAGHQQRQFASNRHIAKGRHARTPCRGFGHGTGRK